MSEPSATRLAHAIRFLAIDAIVRAGEGHQGVPLGMAEIATALYTRHLKFDAGRPDLARPRPRRAVQRPRLDAAVCAAVPERLRAHRHRAGEHLPRLRLALRRPPGVRPRRRHRGDHRSAGPGHRQRLRHGGGRGLPQRALRRRRGRPPHLRLRRRRLPAGGHRPGDDLAGRAPAPGQADPAVGRQPHHRRRRDRPLDQRGRRRALSRRRLARRRSRRARPRGRVGGDRRRQGRPAAVADRLPHGHRARASRGCRASAAATAPSCFPKTPRRRASSWAGRRRRSRCPADVLAAWRDAGRRSRAERERWQARVAALPPAQRAEFERIVAGELPEGWRDVLLDYKRGALDREPLPSGIFISAEINDLLVDVHARAHGRLRRPRGAHQPQAAPDRLHGARTAAAPTCTAACAST